MQVGAPNAESTAWYCTVQSVGAGVDQGSLLLTNTTGRPVAAAVTAVTDTGSTAKVGLTVPPHDVVAPDLPPAASGTWVAQTVGLDGGGVAVTQVVHDATGWAEAPCLERTSSQWYFPVGSTSGSDQLFVALLNPTSTQEVADLSFVTPKGVVHPINYQGLEVSPGQLVVENVASEVQQVSSVSTVVSARTGRLVASEVEQVAASGTTGAGLWMVPGAAAPEPGWTIPESRETRGGSSEIDVLNPGTTPEAVKVQLRLPSGPLAPLSAEVAPASTWVLTTSTQTRIPAGASYTAEISSRGGPGVVVGRRVSLPAAAASPQDGAADAVGASTSAAPSGQWVLPPPGTSTTTVVSGAAPASLALRNLSAMPETYRVLAPAGASVRTLAVGVVAPGSTAMISGAPLAAAGLGQIDVSAGGPMAVSEDVGPSGGVGVVTMPGIALAAPIGGV